MRWDTEKAPSVESDGCLFRQEKGGDERWGNRSPLFGKPMERKLALTCRGQRAGWGYIKVSSARFWTVRSISQSEALFHRGTHLHLLELAAVLPAELHRIAALQDAVEDAAP